MHGFGWGHIWRPLEQKTILQLFYLGLTLILWTCIIHSPFSCALFFSSFISFHNIHLSLPLFSSHCSILFPSPFISQLPFPFSPHFVWLRLLLWTWRITQQMLQSSGTVERLKMWQSHSVCVSGLTTVPALPCSFLSPIWLIPYKESLSALLFRPTFTFHKRRATHDILGTAEAAIYHSSIHFSIKRFLV